MSEQKYVYGVEVLRWGVIEVEAHDEDDARDRAHRIDGVIQVPPNAKVWYRSRLEKRAAQMQIHSTPDGAKPVDWEQLAENCRYDNVRLRKALTNLLNEYPTKSDAMAQAARALSEWAY